MVVKESRSTGSELQHLVLGTQTPFSPAPKYGPFLIIENLFLVFLKLEHILYQYSIYKSVKHSASRHSFAISISKEIFSSLRIYKRVWFPLNLPLFQNKTKFFFFWQRKSFCKENRYVKKSFHELTQLWIISIPVSMMNWSSSWMMVIFNEMILLLFFFCIRKLSIAEKLDAMSQLPELKGLKKLHRLRPSHVGCPNTKKNFHTLDRRRYRVRVYNFFFFFVWVAREAEAQR